MKAASLILTTLLIPSVLFADGIQSAKNRAARQARTGEVSTQALKALTEAEAALAHATASEDASAITAATGKADKARAKLDAFLGAQAAVIGEEGCACIEADPANAANILVDLYCEGHSFTAKWKNASASQRTKLANFIAAKEVITIDDLYAVKQISDMAAWTTMFAPVAGRGAEFLALELEISGMTPDYFILKFNTLQGLAGKWQEYMTPADWLLLSAGLFSAAEYDTMRESLLAMIPSGAPTTSGAEYDASLASLVAALSAPQFTGLPAAAAWFGKSLTLPEYTAKASDLASAIERKAASVPEAKRGLGAVMLLKGVTAYNAWKTEFSLP